MNAKKRKWQKCMLVWTVGNRAKNMQRNLQRTHWGKTKVIVDIHFSREPHRTAFWSQGEVVVFCWSEAFVPIMHLKRKHNFLLILTWSVSWNEISLPEASYPISFPILKGRLSIIFAFLSSLMTQLTKLVEKLPQGQVAAQVLPQTICDSFARQQGMSLWHWHCVDQAEKPAGS